MNKEEIRKLVSGDGYLSHSLLVNELSQDNIDKYLATLDIVLDDVDKALDYDFSTYRVGSCALLQRHMRLRGCREFSSKTYMLSEITALIIGKECMIYPVAGSEEKLADLWTINKEARIEWMKELRKFWGEYDEYGE